MNPYLPTASFPSEVWVSTSFNKVNLFDVEPGFRDYNRISSEVIAIQDYLSTGPVTLASLTVTGDVLFTDSGSGLAYGEISVKDSTAAITLNSADHTQISEFNTNGVSNNVTPDHTNEHIVITKAGMYLVTAVIAVKNSAGQAHLMHVDLFKNNGGTVFGNIHAHRNLSAGSDVGSIALSGIVSCNVDDTLELWATTDSGTDRDVTFEDITFSIIQIGGK